MKLIAERMNWVDTICFAVGFSWEDWHLRQLRVWLDFGIWSFTLTFRIGKEVES